ncbi:MAG: Serine/threonine-protein kinase PknB [Planctomycetota bacterium]|jgi:serine/threonine protein kinase
MESSIESRPPGDGDPAQRARVNATDETLPVGNSSFHSASSLSSTARLRAVRTDMESEGEVVGDYKLLTRLGSGGFGTVWLAKRVGVFDQMVAIKIVKPGMDSAAVIERFHQEMSLLARMDHQHIAKVFNGGETPSGRPFFVMERVDGQPLTRFCDEHRLTVEERLRIFLQICDAVQYAHHKDIVHRDLKPSNILVASDGEGGANAKVIDFGIAKALGSGGIAEESGQMIGTFEYMSPEQAAGSDEVDGRSDVYSLGVILYELLIGVTPLDAKELRRNSREEIQRIIRDGTVMHPRERLSGMIAAGGEPARRAAQRRRTTPARLSAHVSRELGWIPMKATAKDPAERYATAEALAEDIRNYLAGEAVSAVPPSGGYRLRKYMRKHRDPLLVCSAAVIALGSMSLHLATKLTHALPETSDGLHGVLWVEYDGARAEALLDEFASDLRSTRRELEGALAVQSKVIERRQRELDDQRALFTECGREIDRLRAEGGEEPSDHLHERKVRAHGEITRLTAELRAAESRHAWFLFRLGRPNEAASTVESILADEKALGREERELHNEALDFYRNHAAGEKPPARWSLRAPWGGKAESATVAKAADRR